MASRHVVALTGVLLALAGLFPVFGALIVSIPLPVLGGAGLMMFAMIIAAGIQMLDKVARSKRNGFNYRDFHWLWLSRDDSSRIT